MRIITSGGLELSIENNFSGEGLVAPEMLLKVFHSREGEKSILVQNYGLLAQKNINHEYAHEEIIHFAQNSLFGYSENSEAQAMKKRKITTVNFDSPRKYVEDIELDIPYIVDSYFDYLKNDDFFEKVVVPPFESIRISTNEGSIVVYNLTKNPDFLRDIELFLYQSKPS